MKKQHNKNSEEGKPQTSATSPSTISEIVEAAPPIEKLREGLNKRRNSDIIQVTEYEGEAAKKVREMKKDKIRTFEGLKNDFFARLKRSQRIIKPAPISYDAARRIIFDGLTMVLEEQGKTPIWGKSNKVVIPQLISYFIGDPSGSLNPKKGIFLMGETSTGKTLLMKIFRDFVNALDYDDRKFKMIGTNQIEFKVKKVQNVAPLQPYTKGVYCFDDLANEKELKLFSNEESLFDTLLQMRYDSYQNYGLITHATSNISKENLINSYDERTVERMHDMFNFLYLGGENKRD